MAKKLISAVLILLLLIACFVGFWLTLNAQTLYGGILLVVLKCCIIFLAAVSVTLFLAYCNDVIKAYKPESKIIACQDEITKKRQAFNNSLSRKISEGSAKRKQLREEKLAVKKQDKRKPIKNDKKSKKTQAKDKELAKSE